jgi:uncharacterized phage infection (PIP) family protein YhgE
LITDYSWVTSIQKKFETSQRVVQGLQGITKITLPDMEKPRQLLVDFGWLTKTIEIFQKSLHIVQKLKGVSPLTVPNTQHPETLIKEVSNLTSMADKLTGLAGSCDHYKKVLTELKGLDEILDKVTAIEGQVETMAYLTGMEQNFSSRVRTFKELKISYETAVKELNSSQNLLDAFKVCPLCNNPLEHAHG